MSGQFRYQIREVATGRTIVREFSNPQGERSPYWWLEGNYGCDCNRKMEFDRALNQETDDEDNYPCGDNPNAYVFDWVELDGVRFIENDDPTEEATS